MTRDERQKLGVRKWIDAGCRGTLKWCTGSGKTRAAIIAIKSFISKNRDRKITVIVPTDYLKTQWIMELNKFNLLPLVKVEIINSAIKKDTSIDLVILDEHLSSLNSFN